MSRSPRTTASEGKKEKKKHKKEKKHKDGKHHRKSQPPGSIEPVPSKPTLVASNRDPLGVNLSEAELLLRTLNDLSLLPPSTPSPPISSPAIAKVLFAAIDADRVDLALALVVLGADINSLHSTRGITVLALAAEKGDNDAIKYVLVVFFFMETFISAMSIHSSYIQSIVRGGCVAKGSRCERVADRSSTTNESRTVNAALKISSKVIDHSTVSFIHLCSR